MVTFMELFKNSADVWETFDIHLRILINHRETFWRNYENIPEISKLRSF